MKLYEVEIFGDVPWTGVGVEKVIEVREDVRQAFRIVKDGERGQIEKLIFTATIRQYPSQLPLAYCVNYGESMLVAHWQGEGEHNMTMVVTKRETQGHS
ncbi:MAG: hypothetical protein IAG10_05130 [Planctomycetaceae bacterium]|nr:hypothetical protein [Planctomycetaceae bacterium]